VEKEISLNQSNVDAFKTQTASTVQLLKNIN